MSAPSVSRIRARASGRKCPRREASSDSCAIPSGSLNPSPQPVTDLRRPVPCLKGPCAVCPPGQAHAGGCGGAFYLRHQHTHCTSGEIWNGGACLLQTQFLDSCNSLRMTMQRQEQRMRAAESAAAKCLCGGLFADRAWTPPARRKVKPLSTARCRSDTSVACSGLLSFAIFRGLWSSRLFRGTAV